MKKEKKIKKRINAVKRIAIYFNDEYIGEADTIKFSREKNCSGFDIMPMVEIKGDYQAKIKEK